jgi:hypothetical protein
MSREAVIEVVTRAHLGSASADSARAAETLAAHSKLPRRVAENLGAGFGQWDFFPEIDEIVDFALAYVAPETAEDVWTIARAWAADDAASRHTLMALVGREILQHELRRIDVPQLRELVDEGRPSRARELREGLGLPVAARAPAKSPKGATAAKPKAAKVAKAIPTRMPKPEFKRPAKAAPAPDARRFTHPKFGEGELLSQDGVGPDAKLTIRFDVGQKTMLAQYVTEVPRPG